MAARMAPMDKYSLAYPHAPLRNPLVQRPQAAGTVAGSQLGRNWMRECWADFRHVGRRHKSIGANESWQPRQREAELDACTAMRATAGL